MSMFTFSLISIFYLFSLACVDGLFNRLVFKDKRKLSYFSEYKSQIYKSWEWTAIGVIFLIILPVIIPLTAILLFAGVKYVVIYLIILSLVPWDLVFGYLVFDNAFGDTPSIALPLLGWINISLKTAYFIRFLVAIVLLTYLIK